VADQTAPSTKKGVLMQIYKFAEKQGLKSNEVIKRLKAVGYTKKITPLSKITDEMIAKIDNNEKSVPRETPPEPVSTDNGKKIYFSKSEGLTFGGYKPEKRGEGFIQPDESIQFVNHVFITEDVDKQRFIESTDTFKLKNVKIITEPEYNGLMKDLAARRQMARDSAMQRAGRQG
jgi:hypothetical protein